MQVEHFLFYSELDSNLDTCFPGSPSPTLIQSLGLRACFW